MVVFIGFGSYCDKIKTKHLCFKHEKLSEHQEENIK